MDLAGDLALNFRILAEIKAPRVLLLLPCGIQPSGNLAGDFVRFEGLAVSLDGGEYGVIFARRKATKRGCRCRCCDSGHSWHARQQAPPGECVSFHRGFSSPGGIASSAPSLEQWRRAGD